MLSVQLGANKLCYQPTQEFSSSPTFKSSFKWNVERRGLVVMLMNDAVAVRQGVM